MEKEFEDGISIESDNTNAYGSKENSFKNLVLGQYHKCLIEGSKEMTRGGVHSRIINGQVVEHYAADQVQIYINCINSLKDTLNNTIQQNKTFIKPLLKKFYTKKKELLKNKQAKIAKINKIYSSASNNVSPQGYSSRDKLRPIIKKSKKNIKELYDIKMVSLYRTKLLKALTLLIGQMNWFEEA